MNPVTVLVVDPSEVVRQGLALVLSRTRGVHVAGKAATAADAMRIAAEAAPRVALVRDRLPDTSGFDLCRELQVSAPDCAVVLVLTDVTDGAVNQALQAGARGLVHLDLDGDALASAVHSVAHGLVTLDGSSADRLVTSLTQTPLHPQRALSERELEVLQLVCGGLRSSEIADSLGLTVNSVRTYVRRALEKLGCSTRAEAAARLGRTFARSEQTAASEFSRSFGT